jgi:TRAP-type C4-dicarboxylate transport system permease small subunit
MARREGPRTDGSDAHDGPVDDVDASSEAAEGAGGPDAVLLPTREPLRTIFRVLGVLEQIVGSLLLVAVLVLVLSLVAQRYIPGSWPWTGEVARYSMVWATFLVAGYLVAYPPHHIAIQVIDFVVKGRWLAALKLFVNLVILATCLVLIYGSYSLVANDIGQVTPAAQMPLRFVNSVPLVGLVLVALRAVLGIVVNDLPALRGRTGDAG